MTKIPQLANPIDLCAEIILVGFIFFSPLIYGSVTITPITVCELASLFLVFLWLVKTFFLNQPSVILRIPYAVLSGIILSICFQLIPLPSAIVSALFPNTYRVFSDFSAHKQSYITPSIYPDATVGALLQVISYSAVFFVTLQCVNTESQRRRIVLAILICGFLYSFYGMVHRLHMSDSSFSTYVNRNHFAAYIGMIIPLAICYALMQANRIKGGMAIFAAIIMFIALISTLSRAGLACFGISLSTLIVILVKRRAARALLLVIVMGIAGVYMLLVLQSVDLTAVSTRLLTFRSPSTLFLGRLNILRDSVRISKDFPIIGTGLGTFGEAFPLYNTLGVPEKVFSFAHNEAMQAMVEMGIPCLLLLMVFIVSFAKQTYVTLAGNKTDHDYFIALGCGIGMLSIGIHSFFDFVFHIPANMYLVSIMLGMGWSAATSRIRTASPAKNNLRSSKSCVVSIWTAIIALFVLLSVGGLIVRRYISQITFDKSMQLLSDETSTSSVNITRAISVIDRCIILNRRNSSYYAKKADRVADLITKNDLPTPFLASNGSFQSNEDIFIASEQCYKKAIDLNPTNSSYHLKLGWLYSIMGLNPQAVIELKKAVMLNPRSISTHLYVCEYLLSQKNTDEFNKCLNIMVRLFNEVQSHPINAKVWPFLKKIGKEDMVIKTNGH